MTERTTATTTERVRRALAEAIPRGREDALRLVVIAFAYFVAGKLGLALAFTNASASAVWPPTGFAIAAVLLWGRRVAPAVFAGAFLVNVTTAGGVWISLAIALGNTLEALTGAWLARRYASGARAFERGMDTLAFFALAGGLAPMVSATVGVSALLSGGLTNLAQAPFVWLTWWLGDSVGALLVAPAVLLWFRPGARWTPRRLAETATFATLVVVGFLAIVLVHKAAPEPAERLAFALVPLVLLPAVRLGAREASLTTLALATTAIGATLLGFGPFVHDTPDLSLILLQTFMGTVGVLALVLAAVVAERENAEAALIESSAALEKHVEERTARLKDTVAQLEASQRIAHVGSWSWDVQANTLRWSDELYRIFATDKAHERPSYEAYLEAIVPEDRTVVESFLQHAMAHPAPFQFDHRILRPDGEIRWMRVRGEIQHDSDGRVERMMGTAQDITEEVRAEEDRAAAREREQELERLREAEGFRSHLLSTVSHELKTPLTPLKLQLHMLKNGLLGPTNERQARAVEMLDRNLSRLSFLVDQTLEVARIQAARLRLDAREVDVAALVRDVADTYVDAAAHKSVALHVDVPERLVARADAPRITQVLVNLVSNALKFTPPGGRLSVSARLHDGQVDVRVADTGAGIGEEDLAKLFQPFGQLEAGKEAGGTGLGLYISRNIVEAHGGTLEAHSEGKGRGSVFVARWPAQTVNELAAPEPRAPKL